MSGELDINCLYCKQGYLRGYFSTPIIKDCRHFSFFMSSMYENIIPCFPSCGKKECAYVNATCKKCSKQICVFSNHPTDESYVTYVKCIWC